MTPAARAGGGRPAGRSRDWTEFDRPYAPRRSVDGGVAVPRRWKPAGEEAIRLGEAVDRRTTPGIGSRGRTYGRAGQVVEVRIGGAAGGGRADAAIQGSDDVPYAVSLTRAPDGDLDATCTCPYGCDAIEWCKHAAALAFVVGYLVDTDAGLARAWTGSAALGPAHPQVAGPGATGPGTAGSGVSGADPASGRSERERSLLLDRLRADPPQVDAAAVWRAAAEVLPPP